jgi:hypothetical protein
MKTHDSSTLPSLRRPQNGAVLVVVLLAMIGLLGMGLAGLYLTSGSIQMNSNINMRNQALYVAEAGIQTAKAILDRTVLGDSTWQPDLNGMLAGIHSPSGAVVSTPAGYTDEIPGRAGTDPSDPGCSGKSSNGVATRGAYLRDEDPPPSGLGCETDPTMPVKPVYIDCNYPPKYSGTTLAYKEEPTDPNAMSPAPTQYMGKYSLFIRQDLGECRMAGDSFITDRNGIVVVRSEGTASDNRTKVVLEVTMSTNPNVQILTQGIATVCPAGAAGCDDNASVQQGITVGPPAGGSGGGGGGGGTGGTSGACSKTSDCPTGYTCCDGACMNATDNAKYCGTCQASCSGGHCCDNHCCASSGETCCNGSNGLTCAASQSGTTNSSCGFCGTDCTATPTSSCCRSSSTGPYICVDESGDPNNCGGCGVTDAKFKCSSTQSCCGGKCVDTSTDPNNCGKCGTSCGSGVPCCASQCCGSPKICCVDECLPDPGCPTITTIGVYGPWDHGTRQFDTWLTKQAKGCKLWGPQDTPDSGKLWIDLPGSQTQQVVILLDVAHNQKDLTDYYPTAPWYHSVGNSGYQGYMKNNAPLGWSDASALSAWVRGGGGLMTTIGISCDNTEASFPNKALGYITNPSDPNSPNLWYSGSTCVLSSTVLRDSFSGTVQVAGFWRGSSIATALLTGVTALNVNGAFVVSTANHLSGADNYVSYASAQAGTGKPVYLMGAAGNFGQGRLNVWGDEWITYDEVWLSNVGGNTSQQYQAAKYWGNVIKWLGQCPSP